MKPRSGIFTVSGYGVRIRVHRGQLEVTHGFPGERETVRLHRATSKLDRLVVLGHTGTVSLEAMRWLRDIGAAYVHLDADASVISVSAPSGRNDAKLRRAQALAAGNGVGLEIAGTLLAKKLAGQRTLLARLGSVGALADFDDAAEKLGTAGTPEEFRLHEAHAARTYWSAWSDVRVAFPKREAGALPAHWPSFGSRMSPLTSASRKAANPANALLNYLYALLEVECRVAALTLGLDPGLGILHADQEGRDSLALDLIEPVRPVADRLLLDLIASRTFSAREFFETRTGDCRLVAPLPERLLALMPELRAAVAPVAEDVAQQLVALTPSASRASRASRTSRALPTPLTEARRSAGRPQRSKPRQPKSSANLATVLPGTCGVCGASVASGRTLCDGCLRQQRAEAAVEVGTSTLARMRSSEDDPAQTPEARERLSRKRRAQANADSAWDQAHRERPEPALFKDEILPRLADVTIATMARATGLSVRQCSRIRRGEQVPHPRHWASLGELA